MKITFPHMGNMYIPIKVLLDTAGIEYVMPPLNSKETMELGVVNSPEFACMPFKTYWGTLFMVLKMVQTLYFSVGETGSADLDIMETFCLK